MMRLAALVLVLAMTGCAGRVARAPEPATTVTVAGSPQRGADATVTRVAWPEMAGWTAAAAEAALPAFRTACPALAKRADPSGLTQAADWTAPCDAASRTADAGRFFEEHFTPVRLAGGAGFATGYFEPELAGSRTSTPGFAHPLYRVPPDLVEADLEAWRPDWKGRRIRGRVEGGRFVPYHDRAAIEGGALTGRGLELAWAADPDDLFFLHIQGSGRLRLPDGSVMRVGYAGQNGRDYTAVGKLLRERGELPAGAATMDGILRWLRADPVRGAALRRENRSFVFFRELTGPGPVGALGVALTPEASAAADPAFTPLGAPVWLSTRTVEGPWSRLVIAQDTGGAIKGVNRFDIFFGAGERARALAGAQSAAADAVILLPNAAAARLPVAR